MPKNKIKKVSLNDSSRIREPDEVPTSSSNDLHPAFCFKHCQTQFTIDDCDNDAKVRLAEKIYKLSNINWNEIQKSPRHAMGHEIINLNSIRVPLPVKTPGDRNFLSFRLGGGKKSVFIGYRERKVFYVVWIDPNGEVYSH